MKISFADLPTSLNFLVPLTNFANCVISLAILLMNDATKFPNGETYLNAGFIISTNVPIIFIPALRIENKASKTLITAVITGLLNSALVTILSNPSATPLNTPKNP